VPAPGPSFVAALAGHGSRIALHTDTGVLSYTDLAGRVAAVAAQLAGPRRLVLVAGRNDAATLTAYLGALAAGCVVLLVPPGERGEAWVRAYDPDVVVVGGEIEQRRAASAHELHPELALLMTTSGSTGSPRLVRLSHENLQANAEAVACALGVRPDDRAVTTLPLNYCYGLSVVHSHLLRGASLVLTGLSVADTCFWDLVRTTAATSFAAVPYTFDLLDRVGFADRDLPSLRYVTQAGGRLSPDRVRHWAQVGRRRGWDLVVMYGQTEATARMATLPTELALTDPDAVGRAVPGGRLWLERVDGVEDPDVGEVVYAGPNVMLGYAETPADLALGRVVDVLRTGDLGSIGPDGLLRLVGRRSRVAKVLGLRIDLQHVEDELARRGLTACCTEDDGTLVVAADGEGDDATLRRLAAATAGLPPGAVRAAHVGALPRLDSGKPDLRALTTVVPDRTRTTDRPREDLLALYADVLDRHDLDEDTSFVSAGGDSLSYVELSLRLEDALGHLPPGWHTATVGELRARALHHPRRSTLDTSVALRAGAILLIVTLHTHALGVRGGAYVLLGLAGFNVARFALGDVPRRERCRHLLRTTARIAVPTVLWTAGVALTTGGYALANVLQLNAVLGPGALGPAWRLWFIEALLYLLAGVAVVAATGPFDRLERRWPFGVAVGVVAAGLVVRFDLLPVYGGPEGIRTAPVLLWLFGLGWAAARATDPARRAAVSGLLLLAVPGFFGDRKVELVVALGLLALIWLPHVPCPGPLRRVVGALASSSLYIYLTHWQVYPYLLSEHPWLNDHRWLVVLACLAVGVATWRVVEAVTARLRAYRATGTTASASTQRR